MNGGSKTSLALLQGRPLWKQHMEELGLKMPLLQVCREQTMCMQSGGRSFSAQKFGLYLTRHQLTSTWCLLHWSRESSAALPSFPLSALMLIQKLPPQTGTEVLAVGQAQFSNRSHFSSNA